MSIIVITGKEIEKIKGDYESYLSGLNMVGEIDYSQYSQLYDEGTKYIQRAYELGKSELEKENAELRLKLEALEGQTPWKDIKDKSEVIGKLTKANEIIREFMKYEINEYDGSLEIHFEELKKQAEQFLKE